MLSWAIVNYLQSCRHRAPVSSRRAVAMHDPADVPFQHAPIGGAACGMCHRVFDTHTKGRSGLSAYNQYRSYNCTRKGYLGEGSPEVVGVHSGTIVAGWE